MAATLVAGFLLSGLIMPWLPGYRERALWDRFEQAKVFRDDALDRWRQFKVLNPQQSVQAQSDYYLASDRIDSAYQEILEYYENDRAQIESAIRRFRNPE